MLDYRYPLSVDDLFTSCFHTRQYIVASLWCGVIYLCQSVSSQKYKSEIWNCTLFWIISHNQMVMTNSASLFSASVL